MQSLKQKERKEKELKAKLQGEQTALLSRLAELGAYVRSLSSSKSKTGGDSPGDPSSPPPVELRNSLLEVSNMVVDETDKAGEPYWSTTS